MMTFFFMHCFIPIPIRELSAIFTMEIYLASYLYLGSTDGYWPTNKILVTSLDSLQLIFMIGRLMTKLQESSKLLLLKLPLSILK